MSEPRNDPEGERDLGRLVASMRPVLQDGAYVFTTVRELPADVQPVVVVREPEGVTLVLEQAAHDHLFVPYDRGDEVVGLLTALASRSS